MVKPCRRGHASLNIRPSCANDQDGHQFRARHNITCGRVAREPSLVTTPVYQAGRRQKRTSNWQGTKGVEVSKSPASRGRAPAEPILTFRCARILSWRFNADRRPITRPWLKKRSLLATGAGEAERCFRTRHQTLGSDPIAAAHAFAIATLSNAQQCPVHGGNLAAD